MGSKAASISENILAAGLLITLASLPWSPFGTSFGDGAHCSGVGRFRCQSLLNYAYKQASYRSHGRSLCLACRGAPLDGQPERRAHDIADQAAHFNCHHCAHDDSLGSKQMAPPNSVCVCLFYFSVCHRRDDVGMVENICW